MSVIGMQVLWQKKENLVKIEQSSSWEDTKLLLTRHVSRKSTSEIVAKTEKRN